MELRDPTLFRFREVLAAALPYLQTRHNEVHTRGSCRFAVRLLDGEGGVPDVVIPAILLHDIGWSRVPEDRQLTAFGPKVKDPELQKVHEREGARMAKEILNNLAYPAEITGEIVEIILGHDTRPGSRSLQESIVKDADKLFRLSERGFSIDCERFHLDPEDHLGWLEQRIDRWFLTPTGKRLAREEIQTRRDARIEIDARLEGNDPPDQPCAGRVSQQPSTRRREAPCLPSPAGCSEST